jgi:hypothetical protein
MVSTAGQAVSLCMFRYFRRNWFMTRRSNGLRVGAVLTIRRKQNFCAA